MPDEDRLSLVERISLITSTVEAVCGHTDDPYVAGMRVATFCLALNFHMATEADQLERAEHFVAQVRDISGCAGEELTTAIALFSMRAQDMLQEEVNRAQASRTSAADETLELWDRVEALETERDRLRDEMAELSKSHQRYSDLALGYMTALRNLLVGLDGRATAPAPVLVQQEAQVAADAIRGILESPTAALHD